MSLPFVKIKDCVEKISNWNPITEASDEMINYIDLSAVNKDIKKITNVVNIEGQYAPSRARQLVKCDDVLVSTVRPNLNGVAKVDSSLDGATASTGFTVLRSKKDILDSSYLFHWVKTSSFINDMVSKATGQSYPAVSDKTVLSSELLLPPLEEQRRIASILDKADTIRQKRQQAIAKLDELLQATFIDMFGDPVSNPKGWEIVPVGNVTNCIVPGRDKPKSFTGETPWITTEDLVQLGYTEKSTKDLCLSSKEINDVRAKLIPENSVVMSCVGKLGICSIAKNEFVMNQQLHSFQCMDQIIPEFLLFCLPYQKAYMESMASSTTLPYMNKSVCNSIPIILPDLKLQKKWAKIFDISYQKKNELKKQQIYLERLFNSLQQKAFNGTL